jgi:phthalate 4,5-cis-dihydrodiol dehydrogenase
LLPTLRVGIAGLGLASTFTLPYLAQHPHVRITAAADVRESALAQFVRDYGGETFPSVEALCRSPNVDAVYVCTPNYLHAEHAVLAAEHRKHVLVEKPMALTLDECDRMIAAAERNGVHLVYGHTHAYDPPIQKLAEIVRGGELGRLTMMHAWNYTDLLYRPRAAWEMDTARGGGVVFIQAAHQIDIVRLIGGGLVRGVRAMAGAADSARPTEGHYTAYLEFDDGTPATLVYSGYGHFDSAELHYWVGERGQERDPATNAQTRAAYRARQGAAADAAPPTSLTPPPAAVPRATAAPDLVPQAPGAADPDAARREAIRYGGTPGTPPPQAPAPGTRHQYFFGILLVSCARGDVRQSPDGLYVYDEHGKREIALPTDVTGNWLTVDALYRAVAEDRPPLHDGRWGKATLEVALAILDSARQRREILLAHQSPVPR